MRHPLFATGCVSVLCVMLPGCHVLGPSTISGGRGSYNDVIARTSAEQMLGLIVRLRYLDPIGLLTVASVTANLRFTASATSQVGFGPPSNYQGALVPFSAGVGYEDNPTISYTPIEGQAFLREWLEPLSLTTLVSAMQEARRSDALMPLLVERMNHLRSGTEAVASERGAFLHAVALLHELHRRGIANWSVDAGPPVRYELTLSGYTPGDKAEIDDLLRLLGVSGGARDGAPICVPLKLGPALGGPNELMLETRSVATIMRAVADLVEVPDRDVAAGVVTPNEPPSLAGDVTFLIRSSDTFPRRSAVAIEHRGSGGHRPREQGHLPGGRDDLPVAARRGNRCGQGEPDPDAPGTLNAVAPLSQGSSVETPLPAPSQEGWPARGPSQRAARASISTLRSGFTRPLTASSELAGGLTSETYSSRTDRNTSRSERFVRSTVRFDVLYSGASCRQGEREGLEHLPPIRATRLSRSLAPLDRGTRSRLERDARSKE